MKSFIYLDYEKVKSLGSQLFEGITEAKIIKNKEGNTEHDKQTSLRDFRKFSDILHEEKEVTETKYLNDYLYILFEQELLKRGILNVVQNYSKEELKKIIPTSFIKIKGQVIFSDYNNLIETTKNFNTIGEAIDSMEMNNNTKLSNKEREKVLLNKGLRLEKKFIENLLVPMNTWLKDIFEVHFINENGKFIVSINEEFLKEKKEKIINKFARVTEVAFTLVGIVTQSYEYTSEVELNNENDDEQNYRKALNGMILASSNVEKIFNGKLKEEIVVDPIAIYLEI